MSLIKACEKYVLRLGSNAIYHKDDKKAKNAAYAETGKRITHAKQKGYRINGSAEYKKAYNLKAQKAKERRDLREKFIDEI